MKRFFDLVISSLGLILVSPIFVLIFFSVFIILGKPIFFIQKRSGYKKNGFYLIKFRTMLENKKDSTVDDEIRLTKFGSFLRSYSLDELPALFNVLRGDMSIVGPRPLLYEYLELYDDIQIKRHEVKPGITGWAQINGRNNITWQEKFDLDLWYVENNNFLLDLKILFKTILLVLFKSGISQKGHVTSKKFEGN